MNPTCHTYVMEIMCFDCLNFKKISQNNMIMLLGGVTFGPFGSSEMTSSLIMKGGKLVTSR